MRFFIILVLILLTHVVQPQTIVLVGHSSAFDQPDALLKHLAGLLKYAHAHKSGMVNASDCMDRMFRLANTGRSLRWISPA